MPSPKSGYYNAKGERVPGTTTIISRFKDSGALIHWANQLAFVPYRQVRAWMESVVSIGAFSPGLISDAKALLAIAGSVQKGGKHVTSEQIEKVIESVKEAVAGGDGPL